MGFFDFFMKRQESEKRERREMEKEIGKIFAALIEEVRGWVCEDWENRADLVCIAAVTGTLAQFGIGRAEAQWRFMMTEHEKEVED